MLTLNDGRSELWQWDTGRKLTVDADCSQVHFSNKIFGRSIDVDVVDGVAIIPDVLLQTDKDLNVWAFVETAENGYTKISKTFKVNRRNKPADYVFTPPDQTSLEEIKEKIEYLESNQDPDAIKNAVDDYLANNPIMVKETDPTVPEWAKQPTPPDVKIPDKLPNPHSITFTGAVDASYDGSNPVEIKIPDSGGNVDLTGYATEQYVKDYAQPKGNYLTEHQDISGKLDASELPTAINSALAQAKASGEFNGADGKDGEDGKDGYTPVKGVDYFDGSPGKDGKDGNPGADGYTPVKGKDYFDGEDGNPGKDGADGKDGTSATHSWNGTVLTITSASGTSSADLKGDPGEPGVDGADYILTDADKTEIAEMAAELVEIPDSGGNADQIEPMEDDIPKVFFGGALQQTKVEVVVPFRYVSKTEDISGYAKIKAQGDSTMSYPKKNQTVKLFKDVGCTEKMKMNFKGWGKQSKFVFKANWVDLSQARNVVSSRLWADVVKSRADYETLPEQLRKSPNMGAIDGFLVKVYADGVYQGRYTLNIPKDKWMTNMDDSLENHCVLCGEGDTAGSSRFKAEALVDGTDWTDEIHDAVPESIKNRWNEVINFVLNSTDEEFKANLGNYFDVQSLIDYYLFGIVSCNYDGFNKNQLYLTYDGMKWFASVYDLDLTWGISDDGSSLIDYDTMWYMEYDWNKLYCRIDSLFIQELCERWKELRTTVFDVGNIINHFERFTDICPPWLVAEDYAETTANGAFVNLPTLGVIQQIRDFIKHRHAFTNAYLGGHGTGGLMVYELPNEVKLNGERGIDTGVNLNNLTAYTVLVEYTMHDVSKQGFVLDNHNSGNGWQIQYGPGIAFGALEAGSNGVVNAVHPWETTDPTGVRVKVMIRKTSDGVYHFRTSDMGYPEFANFTSKVGTDSPNQNLWLGGCCYEDGTVTHFANATIHDCKVYDVALSDDEAMEYLNN